MFDKLLREIGRLVGDPTAADEARANYRTLMEADLSHDATRRALTDALRAEKAAAGMDKVYCYPREVYDDRVVYELDGPTGTHLYQRAYSIDEAGSVTLGTDVVEVESQTVYTPIQSAPPAQGPEPTPAQESAWELDEAATAIVAIERAFSTEQRVALAKKGQAIPIRNEAGEIVDGAFPIVTIGDLRNAITAFGRAGDKAAAKRHIIKRARALGSTSLLPDEWNVSEADREQPGIYFPVPESGEQDGHVTREPVAEAAPMLVGDIVPLVEKSMRRDGTVPLKIIAPGWGSSGYYDAAVLERDGAAAFPKGTKSYWNHPTLSEEAERPERDLRDLAAETVSDAKFLANGPAGPGLYADSKVFGSYKESVEELAPHIGVSIRTHGTAKQGTAEGKTGPVIEALLPASTSTSIDFITTPGAGGQVLQLFEAARGGRAIPAPHIEEDTPVGDELSESARQRFEAQDTEIARLREAALLREARDVAAAAIGPYDLPDVTRARLVETLAKNPPLTEAKALDAEALKTAATEAVKTEVEYLARAAGIGDGQVRDLGTPATAPTPEETTAKLESAFARLGLSEAAAKQAAAGRSH